jgi:hypothetical protein
MASNVIGVVSYVIAARPSLRNFMIADSCRWFAGHAQIQQLLTPANSPHRGRSVRSPCTVAMHDYAGLTDRSSTEAGWRDCRRGEDFP